MEAIRLSVIEALGGKDVARWTPGGPPEEMLRAWTQHVRTLLVVLDQFEDYFLYHPEEDGEGTFFGEFPGLVNDPNLRVHFLLSIREDALGQARPLRGPHSTPALELRARGAPRAERPPARRSRGRYRVEPSPAAGGAAVHGRAGAGRRRGRRGGSGHARPRRGRPRRGGDCRPRAGRASVPPTRHGAALASHGRGGGARADDRPARRARRARAHRREPPAGGPRQPHSRGAVGRSRCLPASSSHARRRRSRIRARIWRSGRGGASLRSRRCWRSCAAARRPGSFGAFLLLRPATERPATSSSTTSSPSPASSGAGSTSRSGDGGRPFAGSCVWEACCSASRRCSQPSGPGRSSSGAKPRRRPDPRLRSRSRRRPLPSSPTTPSSHCCSGSRRSAPIRAPKRRMRRSPRWRPPAAPERRRLCGAAPTAFGRSRTAPTAARSPRRTSTARCGSGTRKPGSRSVGRFARTHTRSGGCPSAATGERWHRRASTGPSGSGTSRINARSARPSTLASGLSEASRSARTDATSPSPARDDSVRLWDVSSFEEAHPPLQGHRSSVMTIAYSPDGRTLASGGADRTVRLWDVSTGEQLGRTLTGHADKVVSVAFSPDGRTLASSDRRAPCGCGTWTRRSRAASHCAGASARSGASPSAPMGRRSPRRDSTERAAVGRADRPRLGKAASGPLACGHRRRVCLRRDARFRELRRHGPALEPPTSSRSRRPGRKASGPRHRRCGQPGRAHSRPAASTGPCGSGTFRGAKASFGRSAARSSTRSRASNTAQMDGHLPSQTSTARSGS